MKRLREFLFWFFLTFCLGCGLVGKSKEEVFQDSRLLDTARVIKPGVFKESGNVLVLPFRAGPGVEASNELDKIVFMAIKGIADALNQEGLSWRVILNDSQEVNFLIDGHVTVLTEPSKIKRWMPGEKKISLKIEGKLLDAQTQEPILIFEDYQDSYSKEKDHKQLGYEIGLNIGNFIVSQTQ